MRRLIDILVSLSALTLLFPLMVLTAVCIWGLLGRPVFFVQKRPGRFGLPFTLVKFRTMRNTIHEGGQFVSDGDRLTRFGRFLRSTSLDELPELWNVLKGDMSIIGPRPLLMEYLDRYSEEQIQRHNVKPGITGWAQVNGRNQTTWEERFEFDRWYIENQSLLLDLKILGLTIIRLVTRDGISNNGVATMPEFKGSEVSKD